MVKKRRDWNTFPGFKCISIKDGISNIQGLRGWGWGNTE